jgi:hypothetical protein
MLKAARTRQRILAIFLPIAAVLYIGCEALDPKGTDQLVMDVATGLKLLAIAGRHPTQLYVAGTLSLLALGAVAVSYAAIALLVTGRGWVIATVAALLGGLGAFFGAITNVLVGIDLAAAATAHTSPDAAARFLVTAFNSGAVSCSRTSISSASSPRPSSWASPCGAAAGFRSGWRPCSPSASRSPQRSRRRDPSLSPGCCPGGSR